MASDGNAAVSDINTDSQWSRTHFFADDLRAGFVGGDVRRSRGWQRVYRTRNFMIW